MCRDLEERMLWTSISSAWRFRRMPHSPYGGNLSADDGWSCLIHPWTSSPSLASMGPAGAVMVLYKLTPPDTYCCAFAPLRLCAFGHSAR